MMESAYKTDNEIEDMQRWYAWFNSNEPEAIKARELSKQQSIRQKEEEIKEINSRNSFLTQYILDKGLGLLWEEFSKHKSNAVVYACEIYFREAIDLLRVNANLKNEVRDLIKTRYQLNE